MSLYDYKKAIKLRNDESVSFYSLIMAAIIKSDSENSERLKQAFPNTYKETYDRYWSPGGELPADGQDRVVITELCPCGDINCLNVSPLDSSGEHHIS